MSQQTLSFKTIGYVSTIASTNAGVASDASQNTVVGTGAAPNNKETQNTVVGFHALYDSTGGNNMVALGSLAAQHVSAASGAVFVGRGVAPLALSAADSVFVGVAAGSNVVSASGCVLVGPNCGATSTSTPLAAAVCIGSSTCVAGTAVTCVGAASTAVGDGGSCFGSCNLHSSVRGVTVGTGCSNASDGSIVIGSGIANSGAGSLIVVAGSSATSNSTPGTLNIQNVLTGTRRVATTAYDVSLSAASLTLASSNGISASGGLTVDALTVPSITVSSTASNTSPKWVVALSAPRFIAGAGAAAWADLTLTSGHGTVVQFCDDFVPGLLNFTAQHRCAFRSRPGHELRPGSVVVATGEHCGLDGSGVVQLDEAVPVVELSCRARDPRVFGVVSCREPVDAHGRPTFRVGSVAFVVPDRQSNPPRERVVVNSGGEGAILVCDAGGGVSNGDLLVSSPFPGFAMRQGDDVVRACTIAKSTCDCDFVDARHARVLPVKEATIGCVYLCG